jgi:hypothetical protein
MLNAGCTDLVIRPGQVNDNVIAACGNKEPGEIRLNTDAGGAGTWDVRLSAQAEAGMGRSSLAIAASNSAVIYAMSASTVKTAGVHGLRVCVTLIQSNSTRYSCPTRVRHFLPNAEQA